MYKLILVGGMNDGSANSNLKKSTILNEFLLSVFLPAILLIYL
ncbi:MAG: hypothetical protein RR404_00175 [Bacilli bacterium]